MSSTVSSGEIYSGTVQAGDTLTVAPEGVAEGITATGGFVDVEPAGFVVDSTIEDGSILQSAGVVFGTTVETGAIFLNTGLSALDTISSTEIVESGGVTLDDTVTTGGAITVESGGSLQDATIAGGTLNVASAGAAVYGDLTFTGTGGLLEVGVDNAISATISGFAAGDEISISGLATTGDSYTVSGDTVTVTDGTTSYSLDITGASADSFTLADVKGTETLEVVCFLAGTRISTPTGGRAIELLRAGDMVRTTDGLVRPIRWLGRQTVSTRFADALRVAPIRIREGALGDNLPVRDLLVSTDHALLVDGVLVQAGALVNGVSIVREDVAMPETLVYYHVELADHSLILAEGVAAETFIDNVDRLAFDNWDEHEAAEEAAPMDEMPLPRAKSHRQVPQSLRARLMDRAVALYGQDVAAVA